MACAVLLYAVLLGTPTTAAAGLMSETFDYADGLLPGDRWTMTGGEFLCRAGQLYVVSERSNPIVAWRGELANDVTVEARLINAPTCHWSGLQVKSRFRVAVNRQFGHLAISDEQAEGGPKVLAECPNWTTYVNDPFDFRLRVALQGSRICAFADDRLMAEAYHPEASGKGGLALLGGWGTTVAWDDIIVHEGADLHTRPQEVPVGIKQSSLLAITAARWDDPHGLYAPGQKASLAMTIANPREGQFSGVVRLRLVDFWGNVVGAQTLRINLPPGGKTDLVPLITPPGPGVFKVAVDISAGKGGLEWLEDLISLAVIDPAPAADLKPRPESMFGGHVDAIRLDWHLDLAKRLGMRWLRNHDALQWTWWIRTEPQNDQWQWHDEELGKLTDRGLLLLGEFLHCPAWAADAPPGIDLTGSHYLYSAYPPKDWAEFAEYVYETVRHYRDHIHNWEIWNEPYYNGFWKGTPEQYARLAKIAYRECKRADPSCTVWGACTHLSTQDWLERALKAGLGKSMDGLSMHGYSVSAALDSANNPYGGVGRLRNLLAKYGRPGVRIWDTEAGVPSTSFLDQHRAGVSEPDAKYHFRNAAAELVRMYVEHAAVGIEKLFYYNCIYTRQPWPARPESPKDKIDNGLMDVGGVIKPTGVAYATCAALLEDAKFEQRVDTPAGLRAYLFARGDTTVGVVFGSFHSFAESRRVALALPDWAPANEPAFRDVMNAKLLPKALGQGQVEITISRLPWFVSARVPVEHVAAWLKGARKL